MRDVSASKAEALAARGVETVAFDLGDPESIARAFTGASRAFVMTTPANGLDEETAGGIRLVDGAACAGIGHLVFSSVGAPSG